MRLPIFSPVVKILSRQRAIKYFFILAVILIISGSIPLLSMYGERFVDRYGLVEDPLVWHPRSEIRDSTYLIKRGETFSTIMNDLHVNPEIGARIYVELKKVYPHMLYEDQQYSFFRTGGDSLVRFCLYSKDGATYYPVLKNGNSYSAERCRTFSIPRKKVLEASLKTCLYDAVCEQNESPELIARIEDIFMWDINFFIDPRVGDRFKMIYEKYEFESGRFKYGAIPAAVYENQGYRHFAYYFNPSENPKLAGYYDEEGKSLYRRFLRAPLKFSRISSSFSMSRMHPILRIRRAHPAVDYAAPRGTPVYSTASGRVVYAETKGGYGKCVKIIHGNGYCTYYGHLCRYGPGVRAGVKVKQKQVIGYVGRTGLATGSHLDYRLEVGGRYVNPLRIKSPPMKNIPEEMMSRFEKIKEKWRKHLEFTAKADLQTAEIYPSNAGQ
jgi:murein DD-endopeptidase MepM/ murein hydrolase activator NlpD